MCWNPAYIILIILSTIIDYLAAIMMSSTDNKKKRRKYLFMSLISNLGLLFVFKYFNFFNGSLKLLFDNLHLIYNIPGLSILLPVGISFYTFQTLSYTIDVYRGEKKAERHFGIFALYVSFFPQLVAGPIERSTHLLPQFFEKHEFDYHRVTNGLKLVLWGLFKKVVIADRISYFVNYVYNDVHSYQGLPLIIATVLFAFQIYCDFSGYSDMAIGIAQMLGFKLMDNFKRPYFSKSISEFWKRWHISLSSWFRDYVYIPLGGNRKVKWRWYFNLFITFLISGLWHGANWTFVVWGALHGFYLLFSIWTKRIREKIVSTVHLDRHETVHKYIQVLVTFSLVCFSWIFFRANTISDAGYVVTHIFKGLLNPEMIGFIMRGFDLGLRSLLLGVGAIVFMEYIHHIQRHWSIRYFLSTKPALIRFSAYSILVLSIIFLGNFSSNQFIYFQF